MKNLLIIFTSLLIGCSAITKNIDVLYMQYNKYSNVTIDSNNYTKFFAGNLTKKLNESNFSQLSFSHYMLSEIEHFSKVDNNKGCLTIIGLGENNKPIAFYLKYYFIEKHWLISDINISFLENKKQYKKKALCPSDIRVD